MALVWQGILGTYLSVIGSNSKDMDVPISLLSNNHLIMVVPIPPDVALYLMSEFVEYPI